MSDMSILKLMALLLCVLLGVAYMTLLERKILSYVQLRKGPNKVGLNGLLQPIADAMKLFLKELVLPAASNSGLFMLLPWLGLVVNLALWHTMPMWYLTHYMVLNILLFLSISSLNVYVTMGAGWASNSIYSLLGGLRASAQTMSYEISLVFIILFPLLMSQTLTATGLLSNFPVFLLFFPVLIIWFATALAETNRAPFDFAEGESELVSGFNVEYGGGNFALLFLAEYTSILFLSVLTGVCFFSTWTTFMLVSGALGTACMFLLVRGVYPRHRYDMLMMLCWKTFLPLGLSTIPLFVFVMLLMK